MLFAQLAWSSVRLTNFRLRRGTTMRILGPQSLAASQLLSGELYAHFQATWRKAGNFVRGDRYNTDVGGALRAEEFG